MNKEILKNKICDFTCTCGKAMEIKKGANFCNSCHTRWFCNESVVLLDDTIITYEVSNGDADTYIVRVE